MIDPLTVAITSEVFASPLEIERLVDRLSAHPELGETALDRSTVFNYCAAHPERFEAEPSSARVALQMTSAAPSELVVYCADIGSLRSGRFAWADTGPIEDESAVEKRFTRPSGLVEAVMADLHDGRTVALGFESPLFIPVPVDEMRLGAARTGEGNRAWSAGAGAQVLATGLAQTTWTLEQIATATDGVRATTDWHATASGEANLFLWEAFVTARDKGRDHRHDAHLAACAFRDALPDPRMRSRVTSPRALSLVAASLLWSGLSRDTALLHLPTVVIGP